MKCIRRSEKSRQVATDTQNTKDIFATSKKIYSIKIQFPFTLCNEEKKSLFTEYQHLCQHDYERKGTRSTLHAKQSLQQPVFARHEMSTG